MAQSVGYSWRWRIPFHVLVSVSNFNGSGSYRNGGHPRIGTLLSLVMWCYEKCFYSSSPITVVLRFTDIRLSEKRTKNLLVSRLSTEIFSALMLSVKGGRVVTETSCLAMLKSALEPIWWWDKTRACTEFHFPTYESSWCRGWKTGRIVLCPLRGP